MGNIDRRDFIKSAAGISALASMNPLTGFKLWKQKGLQVRAVTQGPKYHWFGYYDKWQFDPTDRFLLGMEVEFEGRTPVPGDVIKIGMIDLEDHDKWIELGESRAWGWQQGCMLQWIPGTQSEIIWNDIEKGHFVSRRLNVLTGEKRTFQQPVYALSQDGQWAIGADFSRIQKLRPGYGYQGVIDPYQSVMAPGQSGIYKMDLQTGHDRLIISLEQLAEIKYQGEFIHNKWHWVNHLLVSPDNQRFIFLHRWREKNDSNRGGGFTTRMFTADKNGNDLYILDPSGYTSHFIWRDPSHVAAWTKPHDQQRGFWLLKDKTEIIEPLGMNEMTANGHLTYLPHSKNEWILNDTYPQGDAREQIPYVYHIPTRRKIELGRFHSPPEYSGEWRCDTHPRYSHSGRMVCIDSPHEGNGRQMYVIDIRDLI